MQSVLYLIIGFIINDNMFVKQYSEKFTSNHVSSSVASSRNSVVSSSSSSLSSHNSEDNILYSSAITDKDGNTFTEKVIVQYIQYKIILQHF